MKKIIYFLIILSSFIHTVKAEELLLTVDFQQTHSTEMQQIRDMLLKENRVMSLVKFMNDEFKVSPKGSIKLVFSDADDEEDSGAYTDLATRVVVIPYQFIQEVKNRFEKTHYSETNLNIDVATIDVVLHTILHETAHTMITFYDVPIVGKEEDAADSLATFILSERFEEGQEIAISAADLFDLERQDNNELDEANYWGEHSLEAQRFYTTMCHVYGSNPERYTDLLNELNIDKKRQTLCIEEYQRLARSWSRLLADWLKK
ncbi:DUF4344 domain-containing metallopeptidase [Pasteurella skyensis]|uniref:DUF4344 domain-containing metallopeptidase n=1 Tax=Phocoenobacter skyensis TaxID=97481 RepID=A0AAJ6N8W9_9PAST|nr:DUF4344 domain-containing metallopeptidase [Pasteurella skyensis]MDP8162321.1 DUF4344 domain-containing metallopeptidase [Pasteurella skyensis]MDP8172345.1 DUF4344 domain-containing metallopeptidase [Pasteurella skyensis]MDP8177023.1 DUF4344 domain-containing metallopeptidase [Pasteurella skyensis]MDP8178600.1 DUF4344 domain-containing metallopeptidase [Pasteurella skyensis]MDP8182602.1 DUF4344 domain-containing metallopeptidase [Pasteurella skyensis]